MKVTKMICPPAE